MRFVFTECGTFEDARISTNDQRQSGLTQQHPSRVLDVLFHLLGCQIYVCEKMSVTYLDEENDRFSTI